ncbi:hypothetical protein [Streptomyces sp. NPDC047123]|uniref:hypothetical protein n=1 Tax=Streptomyces sp. NPDC047123 TaxID=3155622 RepID=UPI0033E85FE8
MSVPPTLPPVAVEVAATALDPLPARLRKRVDGAVTKAAGWQVTVTEDDGGTVVRAVVRVDDETAVTLTAPHGVVATADHATCTCLLAPACLHRAAVLLRAPLAEGTGEGEAREEADEAAEGEAGASSGSAEAARNPHADTESANSSPTAPAPRDRALTGAATAAVRSLWSVAADVLVAGVGGVGAVHRARLLHAAHSARLSGLHRPSMAAVRVVRRLGEAASGAPEFRLAGLTAELTELLYVLRALRTAGDASGADPALVGTARRAYRPERPLRLHGLFTEPVVTASGYAGAVTYALAPDGRLRTVADVAPGGPDRVARATGSSVPGGAALSLRELSDGGGVTLTGPTVSPDGRIGAGRSVRSVRSAGAAWTEEPLDALWQRAPHLQLADALAWWGTPADERASAGGDLVFLRGAVTTGGLAVADGPTLRLLAPDERPELPYAENLRLLAGRTGLPLRVVARVDPDRPGGVLVLAAAWTGPGGRTFRVDLGLRRLDRTQLPPHEALDAVPALVVEPPALPMELGLLRRAVDRAVAGGRPVAAADTDGGLPRRLSAVGLSTAAHCAHRLTDTATDRRHDALGRLRPADPEAYAEAWLATSLYTRAATASLLTAGWTP